ncbi:hypothetical protein SAMN06265371_106203 [Lutibacter agarilyticus]|uniref:Uncharacterized protein n=1 Tax=Lutibacter agarilyticus TaxID=1109740 RepID=A0A238XQC8_9FLAO|nr:hypothetical protein [Lutibacter agarilyticus]SNR60554.1 hypothetical protein SAMN06265371_106203 [Lutibacter agarilyticus]
MKEIIKSFFEASRERIKNPLIGTFLISWIAINWKPISILFFSNKDIEYRITHINDNYSSFQSYFLVPFIITIVYLIILPYFMWGMDEILNKSIIGRKKNIIKQLVIDIKGKQELAEEENKLEDLKAKYRDKADLNKLIEKLKKQLEDRDNTIDNLQIDFKTLNEDYSQIKSLVEKDNTKNLSENTLKKLENDYKEFKESDLYEDFREIGLSIRNRNEFPNHINDIIKEKYLYQNIVDKITDDENQRIYYELTDKGNFFWREYIMNVTVVKKRKVPPPPPVEQEDLPF